jgi:HTH-type transcriptional regulator/antitoxin HigA
MIPKVIKTQADHEAALAHIETLMDAESGTPEEAELELWSLLVEKYEDEHFPVEMPDPVDAIRFRMEQQGLTQADLTRFVRSKSKVSEVLGRHRPLSLSMIRSFHSKLGIPTDVLVQEVRRPKHRPSRKAPSIAKSLRRGVASLATGA